MTPRPEPQGSAAASDAEPPLVVVDGPAEAFEAAVAEVRDAGWRVVAGFDVSAAVVGHVRAGPIASADDLPSPYKDVSAIPTTFFIDRKGVIQNVFVGYHDFDNLKTHALAQDFAGEPKQGLEGKK